MKLNPGEYIQVAHAFEVLLFLRSLLSVSSLSFKCIVCFLSWFFRLQKCFLWEFSVSGSVVIVVDIFLLIKEIYLLTLSNSSCLPQKIRRLGISRPPCSRSLEYYLLGLVILHLSLPPPFRTNKQVELIFFDKFPTIFLHFNTFKTKRSWTFLIFLWQSSILSRTGT